jgi:phosphomannomutase
MQTLLVNRSQWPAYQVPDGLSLIQSVPNTTNGGNGEAFDLYTTDPHTALQVIGKRAQTSDGLRIDGGDGWVLLSPDSDGPYISVHAEGHSDSQAQALLAQYAALIGSMQTE